MDRHRGRASDLGAAWLPVRKLLLTVACVGIVGCSSSAGRASTPGGASSLVTSTAGPTTVTTTATLPETMITEPTTTLAPVTTTTVVMTTVAPTTTIDPDLVRRVFPVLDAGPAGWSDDHSTYPATDIFHPAGCGSALVAPVDGTVLEIRREDLWSAASDDPSARGGKYLSILGDDGVRYYMAHFQKLEDVLAPGVRVAAGQLVGEMGTTGRSGACHLHFALSPPCPGDEWWVRRGAVWPYPYLEQWQQGVNASPVDEIATWASAHPTACSTPAAP